MEPNVEYYPLQRIAVVQQKSCFMQIWISIVEVFDDQTPSEIYDSLVFFTNK